MRLYLCIFLASISLLLICPTARAQNDGISNKRGLAYGSWSGGADHIWNAQRSPLTWYYNFKTHPSNGIIDGKMQFVPMMWGASENDTGFTDKVLSQIKQGADIEYVLGFNEPDICYGGGSCVDAETAATVWKKEIEPLKKHGIKLGAPSVTGGDVQWLQDWFAACDGGCTVDFIPLHYYATITGLREWVHLIHGIFEKEAIWVTEFACPDCDLVLAEETFNASVEFLDGVDYVTHYSYFGSFRTDKSNTFLGPNVAMLDDQGKLTDIGVWYLGLNASDVGKSNIGPEYVPSKDDDEDGGSGSSNGGGAIFGMVRWWEVLALPTLLAVVVTMG